jgi:hypothetical protein
MPLSINQSGYPRLSFWAKYETAPLKSPIYYSVASGLVREKKGWEIELNHLKIYLKNRPAEISRFSVSHGYNQFFISRINDSGKTGKKFGAGLVIAHPENKIRNLTLNEKGGIFNNGYYISGPALVYGLYKKYNISSRFFLQLEMDLTFAFAVIPIEKGKAQVPVAGIHLKAGPGYFITKK